jgi:hypothetical protein
VTVAETLVEPLRPPVTDRRAIAREAHESRWTAQDGQAIRRIDWTPTAGSQSRGSLLTGAGKPVRAGSVPTR